VNGITQSLTASVTLRSLAAAATGLKQHGDGAATLRALSVAGAGRTGVTQHLGAAVGLGRVSPSANLVNRYLGVAPRVEKISGVLRSNGAARFQYTGKANAGVIWEISAGSGNLTPDHPYTDEHGVCLASYEPEGYEGQLTIQVHFA
jgi:hypothetical protein